MGRLPEVTVTPVQPYQARKEYICPGCNNTIPQGTFHVVVVPDETPDLRRHWHQGCWYKEQRRVYGESFSPHASGGSTDEGGVGDNRGRNL